MDTIYGKGKASRTESVPPPHPRNLNTTLPPGARLRLGDAHSDGEVLELIRRLPDRKACGVDIIGNEALKMSAEIIAPHLELLFAACFIVCYHPRQFKISRTIVFHKSGKPLAEPKSYRPISLLSSIDKLLERLVVNRLKAVIEVAASVGQTLLPAMQFGGLAGKSTTMALLAMTNFVYTGWAKGMKVSLLGLDISGAFPHVTTSTARSFCKP